MSQATTYSLLQLNTCYIYILDIVLFVTDAATRFGWSYPIFDLSKHVKQYTSGRKHTDNGALSCAAVSLIPQRQNLINFQVDFGLSTLFRVPFYSLALPCIYHFICVSLLFFLFITFLQLFISSFKYSLHFTFNYFFQLFQNVLIYFPCCLLRILTPFSFTIPFVS